MKEKMLNILLFLITAFSVFGQSKNVKIQFVYNNNKLTQENHFNNDGKLTIMKNLNIEHFGCSQVSSYYSKTDTAVFINIFDSLGRVEKELKYTVENGIKTDTILNCQFFYNKDNRIAYIKESHPAFHDKYFKYDSIGNEIMDSSDVVYIKKYKYSEDHQIEEMKVFKTHTNKLFFRDEYFYDSLGNIIRLNHYNWDNLLVKIIIYKYNEKSQLTFEEETSIPVYTNIKQRKNEVSSYSYKYNENGDIIEKYGIGQWSEPMTITYEYEYF